MAGAARARGPASRWSSAGLMLWLAAAAATAASTGYSVPSYLKICHKKDPALNMCLKESINTLLRRLATGSKELDVPPLDPLYIPLLEFDLGKDNVSLKLLLKNVNLFGLSAMNILSVKSSIEDHKMEVTSKIPLLDFRGEYSSEGRVMEFPVYSSGSFSVNMSDVTAMWFIYLQHTGLNVTRYLMIENFGLDVIPSSIGYHFGGALDGDNNLGEVTNVFLNENSNEIFNDMKPKIVKSLSEIFSVIANQILSAYPKEVLLPSRR
ncbi:protein takeout-like [Bacillus rossius redtenbacheri]|uniref:protein takeout-like n=1 Tax=Bacillus rossius redtenbacheri TaxID=93214 RepID=UPI002FDD4E9E